MKNKLIFINLILLIFLLTNCKKEDVELDLRLTGTIKGHVSSVTDEFGDDISKKGIKVER